MGATVSFTWASIPGKRQRMVTNSGLKPADEDAHNNLGRALGCPWSIRRDLSAPHV